MITNTLPELPQQGFIDRGNSRGAIKPKELQYIPIFTFRHDYILVNDIVCLEGQSNYTMIYLKNGRIAGAGKEMRRLLGDADRAISPDGGPHRPAVPEFEAAQGGAQSAEFPLLRYTRTPSKARTATHRGEPGRVHDATLKARPGRDA